MKCQHTEMRVKHSGVIYDQVPPFFFCAPYSSLRTMGILLHEKLF